MKNNHLKSFLSSICIGLLSVAFYACSSSDGNNSNSFDRALMLQNYAEKMIIPAYANFQTQVNALQTANNTFQTTPNSANLANLQTAWLNAATAWQSANAFNFGPAGEQGLTKNLNEEIATFPVNTARIEFFISNNDVSFNNFERDTRGLMAVEYLLYESTQGVLSSANKRNYLNALIQQIKTRTDAVVTAWATYKSVFIANTGTDIGSSTSALYNEFVKSYENLKNFKVSLPLGKRAGQTQTEPTKVEAYYSARSFVLMKAHFTALENLWNASYGFRSYLENATGGADLVKNTTAQITAVKNVLNAIDNNSSFSQIIQNNPASLESLYVEMQKLTRFFKSDMSSILGIAITYDSGDGD